MFDPSSLRELGCHVFLLLYMIPTFRRGIARMRLIEIEGLEINEEKAELGNFFSCLGRLAEVELLQALQTMQASQVIEDVQSMMAFLTGYITRGIPGADWGHTSDFLNYVGECMRATKCPDVFKPWEEVFQSSLASKVETYCFLPACGHEKGRSEKWLSHYSSAGHREHRIPFQTCLNNLIEDWESSGYLCDACERRETMHTRIAFGASALPGTLMWSRQDFELDFETCKLIRKPSQGWDFPVAFDLYPWTKESLGHTLKFPQVDFSRPGPTLEVYDEQYAIHSWYYLSALLLRTFPDDSSFAPQFTSLVKDRFSGHWFEILSDFQVRLLGPHFSPLTESTFRNVSCLLYSKIKSPTLFHLLFPIVMQL